MCKPQRRGLRIRRGISAEANQADQIRHEEPLEFGYEVRFRMGFVRSTSGVISAPFYEKATPSQTSLLIENLIGKGCSEVPEELLGLVEPFPLNLGLLQILINPFKQPLAAQ